MNDEMLGEIVDNIVTKADFIAFVNLLSEDAKENLGQWDNFNISLYLLGVAGWTGDMEGYFRNNNQPIPEQPTWNLFGHILFAAKFYE